MRLFIGIELPKNIKEHLYGVEKEIGNEFAKIKWVNKKQIHLTLKFLGEVEEDKLDLIKEALSYVKFKKFRISVSNFGWYPNEDRVNVIWVGMENEKEVFNLHSEIELKLGSLFEKDGRFSVHITLGRVKFVKNKEKFLDILKSIGIKNEEFWVDGFSLIKSELSKDGSKYFLIEKYDLE
ncbi:RNA 2',3'-cyclic phosphodiesterase [Candidatus Woesearchaeota archaeon]|nr:RNA 2',3'-cyclic phosphodiesterase [Candidatus Woesearchaeota archaeon]